MRRGNDGDDDDDIVDRGDDDDDANDHYHHRTKTYIDKRKTINIGHLDLLYAVECCLYSHKHSAIQHSSHRTAHIHAHEHTFTT